MVAPRCVGSTHPRPPSNPGDNPGARPPLARTGNWARLLIVQARGGLSGAAWPPSLQTQHTGFPQRQSTTGIEGRKHTSPWADAVRAGAHALLRVCQERWCEHTRTGRSQVAGEQVSACVAHAAKAKDQKRGGELERRRTPGGFRNVERRRSFRAPCSWTEQRAAGALLPKVVAELRGRLVSTYPARGVSSLTSVAHTKKRAVVVGFLSSILQS